MDYQTTEILNTENIKLGASQIFYRGRSDSASGLILPSPVKKSLNKSKEGVLLHHSAVQFSTGGPVQFSPGIYKHYLTSYNVKGSNKNCQIICQTNGKQV